MRNLLIPVHVTANLVWIGSILAVVLLLARGPGDGRTRGAAGLLVYRALAVPGFITSFTLGLVQLLLNPDYYFRQTHFMHAKLAAVAVIIALHHVIGARARAMEAGTKGDAGATPLMAQIVGACAFAAVVCVLLRVPA